MHTGFTPTPQGLAARLAQILTGAPHADGPEPTGDEIEASLRPIARKDFGYDQARHLLWRAGFGGTSAQVRYLADLGPERAVDILLNDDKSTYPEPSLDQFDRDLMRPATSEEAEAQRRARRERDEETLARLQEERQRRERLDRQQLRELQRWWLTRMIETSRPLEEKLTLFWHGHFATSYRGVEDSFHMYMQNLMFRTNGMGSFRDLLKGLIRDPAMLKYLNNDRSRKGKPNENLAREIMELFSLGLGNYSEDDIKEGARALTGYTFKDDDFEFDQRNHDNGSKAILGHKGNLDGDEFVEAILSNPACAPFVVRRLYNFFVADVPPDERGGDSALPTPQRAVLRNLSNELRSRNYFVKPVLKKLFLSEHFYSPAFLGQQIKSPAQLVVGSIRSLNTPVRDLNILLDAMDRMGQNLMMPPSVKGWDGGRAWVNTTTMFVRQNVLTYSLTGMSTNRRGKPDAQYDPSHLLADIEGDDAAKRDAERVVEHLLRQTLGSVRSSAKEVCMDVMSKAKNPSDREAIVGTLLLITAMPEYQLC